MCRPPDERQGQVGHSGGGGAESPEEPSHPGGLGYRAVGSRGAIRYQDSLKRSGGTARPSAVDSEEAETSPAAAIAALVRQESGGSLESFAHRGSSGATGLPDFPGRRVPGRPVRSWSAPNIGGHAPARATMADQDVRTSRTTGGRGFLLSGSEDRRIRYWDLSRVDRSEVLTGMDADTDKSTYSSVAATSDSAPSRLLETWVSSLSASHSVKRPPQRLSLISHNQHDLLRGHQDNVTALACIDSPFRGAL
ncbi:hypothetical protein EVJ58_g8176 [Rhodofomes roseus]|uniref:Uncharacterized protein n=1 Tax=Rhodofomes roseus TaxID=34475 RepID=A0A4Y9XZH4_9APHY|nr:hypothetical protein EVJ58_g8176 [Rhodofomes roseus]